MTNIEKIEFLIEEYKLCQQDIHQKDISIWTTFSVFGVTSIAAFAYIAADGFQSSGSPNLGTIVFSLLIVVATWMWWIMANRWW